MRKLFFLLTVMLITVGISVGQSNSSTSSDQNNNSATSQSSTPSDQNATSNPSSTPSDQSATTTDQTTTSTTTHKHRGTASATDQNTGTSAQGGNLPQTASPLPLLGLLGLGSLAAGVITRKKKNG